jgi:hypothetical protein
MAKNQVIDHPQIIPIAGWWPLRPQDIAACVIEFKKECKKPAVKCMACKFALKWNIQL